jgi:hypothetical protein
MGRVRQRLMITMPNGTSVGGEPSR